MTPSPRAGPAGRPATTWLLGAAVACVALFAVLRGQTTAWDLRNYHLYAPWALLHDRAALDLAPAQLQTWFNPLLSVPYFLASTMLPAWACTFLLGLVQGTNVLVLHAIARRVFPSSATGIARFALPVAVAVGFLSATSVSEIGTTYGDNLVSIPCLASLALLLRAFAADGATRANLAGAGLLAGIAVGLKLVVAPFALGLVAIAAFLPGSGSTRLRALLVFGIALLVGVALAGGWNFWRNWLEFGNPVYPQFGHFFGGRWDPPFAVSDLRWQVHGLGQAFGRPLDLISHWEATGELRFRDARLPLMLFTALAWPWCRRRIVEPDVRLMLDALCAGFLVAWCAWLVVFGYHRYLCGWEMLAPIVAIAALVAAGARPVFWGALAFLLIATTLPANLGTAHFAPRVVDARFPPLAAQADGLVLLAGDAPTAYLVTAMGEANAYVRISGNLYGDPRPPFELDREAARRIDAHRGRVLAMLQERNPAQLQPVFARFGLQLDVAGCAAIASNLTPKYEVAPSLCPVRRLEPAATALARIPSEPE